LDRETDGEHGGIGAIFAALTDAYQPVLASAAQISQLQICFSGAAHAAQAP
jgi:hypothetical protein